MSLEKYPCLSCEQPYYDCKGVKAATSCIFYYADNGSGSLLTGLNLPNGTSLTKILEKIDVKLSSRIQGINVSSFNLGSLKNEYAIIDFQSLIEGLADKANKHTVYISNLTNEQNSLRTSITNIQNFLNNPSLTTLYPLGITTSDSLKTIIEKIVNAIGVIQNSGVGGNGSSPSVSTIDTPTVKIQASGTQGHTLSADVRLSSDSGNIIQAKANGLFASVSPQTISYNSTTRVLTLSNGGSVTLPAPTTTTETAITATATPTATINAIGTSKHTLSVDVNINGILDQTLTTPSLRSKFCQICENTDPCAGGNSNSIWVDTGETQCKPNSFTLEKRQKDTNICSSTYNTFRWITAETNSLSCGYGSAQYCVEYYCGTTGCAGCPSIRACLKDQYGNNIVAPALLTFTYDYTVNGVTTVKTFTIAQGQTAGEACECSCPSNALCTISNVQAPSGYVVCQGGGIPIEDRPVPPAEGIGTKTLTRGVQFNYTMPAWQKAVSYAVTGLPTGISFVPTSRLFTGTPTIAQTKEAVITATGATGLQASITLTFDVKEAPIYKFINSINFTRDSSGLELIITGEGGDEGIETKFGSSTTYQAASKTANQTYKRKYFSVPNGNLAGAVRLVGTTTEINFTVNLTTTPQTGKIYPGTNNILTGKTATVSSGDNIGYINDSNNTTIFETDEQDQPAIRFDLKDNNNRPFVDYISITPGGDVEDWQGMYVILTPTGTGSATRSFNQNANIAGALVKRVPLDQSISPIVIDLPKDVQYGDVIIQSSDEVVISLADVQLYGSYPVVNTPPTSVSAIPDITRTEGTALSYDVKDKFTDAEGDALTYTAQLVGGFSLPSWITFSNGIFTSNNIQWQGGESGSTVYTYNIRVTVQDTSGGATTSDFKFNVQKAGTLDSLNTLQYNYDNNALSVAANVSSGPLEVRLVGISQAYGDNNWKSMTTEQPYAFPKSYNRIFNYFPNVLAGTYKLELRQQDGGTIFSRTFTTVTDGSKPTIYEKTSGGTPSISAISHTFDSSGKPTILSTSTGAVEIQLVQISGTGFTETGWASASLISGAENYRRVYTTVPPSGDYRYDVRLTGNNTSIQSGSFTVGASTTDYFLQVDWTNATTPGIRVQTSTRSGVEWKLATSSAWNTAGDNGAITPSYPNDPIISGAFKYSFNLDSTSTSTRVLQLRKTGTTQILNVTVPAGIPAQDGSYNPIYGGNFYVTQGSFEWDSGNNSAILRFVPKTSADTLQIAIELASGSDVLSGTNFGEGGDSGAWTNKSGGNLNWFDLLSNTTVTPFTLSRRFEKGATSGSTGIPSNPVKVYIRKKNTTTPIQSITHTPVQSTAGYIMNITSPSTGNPGGGGDGDSNNTGNPITDRNRIVLARDLGIAIDSPTGSQVVSLMEYHNGWKQRGGNAAQFCIDKAGLYANTSSRNAAAALVNNMVSKGLKASIHFVARYEQGTRPVWLTDAMLARYGSNNSIVSDGAGSLYLSLAYLDAWKKRGTNPGAWNDSNPWWRWAYEDVIPFLQLLGNDLFFVSFGCSKTYESGYTTHDTNGVLDDVSGYEQAETDLFRARLLERYGTIAAINQRFGTNYSNISNVNLAPVKSGESFRSTFNGQGIGLATFLHRTDNVRTFQEFCEWIVREAANKPNIKVPFEAGTTFNVQAALYANTHVATLSSTADFLKENLITGYADQRNWEMGAHRLWSFAPGKRFWAELDASLIEGGYFRPAYGSSIIVPDNTMYNKVAGLMRLGGDVSFFAFSSTTQVAGRPTRRELAYDFVQKLNNEGLVGTKHATQTPSASMTYNTKIFRSDDNGGSLVTEWESKATNGKFVQFNVVEEVWPSPP